MYEHPEFVVFLAFCYMQHPLCRLCCCWAVLYFVLPSPEDAGKSEGERTAQFVSNAATSFIRPGMPAESITPPPQHPTVTSEQLAMNFKICKVQKKQRLCACMHAWTCNTQRAAQHTREEKIRIYIQLHIIYIYIYICINVYKQSVYRNQPRSLR